jgi:hypothetical protein
MKMERGWKWNGPDGNGGTFPTPGGNACGACVSLPRRVLRRGAIKAVARELCRQKRIDPDAMEPGQVRGKSDVTLPNGDPANAMWKYHTEEAKRIIDVMLEYLPHNVQAMAAADNKTPTKG